MGIAVVDTMGMGYREWRMGNLMGMGNIMGMGNGDNGDGVEWLKNVMETE